MRKIRVHKDEHFGLPWIEKGWKNKNQMGKEVASNLNFHNFASTFDHGQDSRIISHANQYFQNYWNFQQSSSNNRGVDLLETPNMMDECNEALVLYSAKENLFTYKQMPISEFEFFMSKKFRFVTQLKYPDETTISSLKASSFDF